MKSADLLKPRIETIVPKTLKGLSTFQKNLSKMPYGSKIEIVFSSKEPSPVPGITHLTEVITASGHEPVPHIAARGLQAGQLRPFLEKLTDSGVREVLVIGGDPNPPVGPYRESLQILEEIVRHNKNSPAKFTEIGLAGHPDGHPQASLADVRKKVVYLAENGIAAHIQTQPSGPGTIINYAGELKKAGIEAPVLAGVFGPGTARDFLNIMDTIGAKKSSEFLRKNPQVLLAITLSTIETQTFRPLSMAATNIQNWLRYGPGNLIHDLSTHPNLGKTNIQGIYLFSLKNFGNSVNFYLRHSANS